MTSESFVSNPSAQTVPQVPLYNISTLPALTDGPPTKRTFVSGSIENYIGVQVYRNDRK